MAKLKAKLLIDNKAVNTDTHRIDWIETSFVTNGNAHNYSSASNTPVVNSNDYYSLLALKNSAGSSDAVTFEIIKFDHSNFTISDDFEVGNSITVSSASALYTIEEGKTSASDVLIGLKDFLNSDNSFNPRDLHAI